MRLPLLALSYGTQLTQDYRRKRLQMGDGYSVRSLDGLNAKPQQWKLVWENIPNAEAEFLRQFFEDLGGVFLVRWTPTNQATSLLWTAAGFSSQPSTWGKSTCSISLEQEFDMVGPKPENSALPVITPGGGGFNASNGAWTNNPDDFFYQWYRAGEAIPDATGAFHPYRLDDVGQQLTVEVSAGNLGGETTAMSAPVTVEGGAVVEPPAPTLDNSRANSDTVMVSSFTSEFTTVQDQIAALEV